MKHKTWIIWMLVVCLLFSGCSLLNRGETSDETQENTLEEPICSNCAIVLCNDYVYLQPDGNTPVAVVSEGSSVTFDKVVGKGELWVHLTGPATEGWIPLSRLEVDGYAGALPVEIVAGAPVFAVPDTTSGEIHAAEGITVITGSASAGGGTQGAISYSAGTSLDAAPRRSAVTGMLTIDGNAWCLMIDGTWVQAHDLVFSCEAESACYYDSTYPYSIVGSWYYLHSLYGDRAEEECWTFLDNGTVAQTNFCYDGDLSAPLNPDDTGIPGVYVYEGTDLTVSLTQQNAGVYKYMAFLTADSLILIPNDNAACMVFTSAPKLGPEGTLLQSLSDAPADLGNQDNGGGQPSGGQPSDSTGAASELVGVWAAYQCHYMEDGHGGGAGFELYLCENGYGVLELSDGEISDETYYINHSHQRLYGRWQVNGSTFQFTVLEDWLYADGQNIGQIQLYPFRATEDGFTLEYADALWTFQPAEDWSGYLDAVRAAAGGSTGNDQTGTREDVTIEGLAGHWVLFEEVDGKLKRHLLYFDDNGSFSYFCRYLEQQGSNWVPGDWIDPYIDSGSYCLVNGSFTMVWDPEEYTGLTITVSGDTLTITTPPGYQGSTSTGVFTRYDGNTDPMP